MNISPPGSSSPRGRVLALDIGDRYIGIAATDHTDPIAYRYGTIDRTIQDAIVEITRIVRQENIARILFGVPYHMEDGSETDQTRKTRTLIEEIRRALGEGIAYEERDETLTSREARRSLVNTGESADHEHAEAARILLEEYLRTADV